MLLILFLNEELIQLSQGRVMKSRNQKAVNNTLCGSRLSAYKFDTSGYAKVNMTVRRDPSTGRLVDTSQKFAATSSKK